MRWAVILAGGVGSRFWPLSHPARPKQLLPLASDVPLLIEAVERLAPMVPAERVLVVTSRELAPAISAALPALAPGQVIAEPRAASTLPALAWATATAASRDPDASVLSLHADWVIADAGGFRAAAAAALEVAEIADVLVTVGARATRAETGFGYIVPGLMLAGAGHRIVRFIEKPDAARAATLLAEGAVWNTGLFAWTATRFRAEVAAHAPELAAAQPALDALDLETFYARVTPVSVDVGLFERTARGAVVPAAFGWDDVGSWAALLRVRHRDAHGNVAVGDSVHIVDARDCVVWSESGPVIVDGVDGLVVVQANGVTLVTTTARAPDLKRLLDQLPAALVGNRGA